MIDKLKFVCASDKDIFDLLMSARHRLSENVLLHLALERGIIYSAKTDRDRLASDLSLLPHDYKSISKMIERREQASRAEKRAFAVLPYELSKDEIAQVVESFKNNDGKNDVVTTQMRRADGIYMNVEYHEVDYSKTRLIQRQKRDAGIEVVAENGKTVIRMPATEKARDIVAGLKKEADKIKLINSEFEEVSLREVPHRRRTEFFISLMESLPGYQAQTVTRVRVASSINAGDDDLTIDLDESDVITEEVISQVSSVTLSGLNLLQSNEYQVLQASGFFVTALTWRSMQLAQPQDLMQFDVSFDNARDGTGFKFGVRMAQRQANGELSQHFKPLEVTRQPGMWKLVESTSATVLRGIIASLEAADVAGGEGVV
jgi:hypothetical protein